MVREDGTERGVDPWPDPLAEGGDATETSTSTRDRVPTSLSSARLRLLVGAVVLAVVVRTVWGVLGLRDGSESLTYVVSSSAFFIGVPAVLAWWLLRRAPAETAMGRVMTGTTAGLLLTSMVLGEAAICVALAAPLVYLAAWAVTAAWQRWQERGRHLAVVALLLPLLPAGTGGIEEVVVVRDLPVATAEAHAAIAAGPRLSGADRPWLLTLGYPVPGDPVRRSGPGAEQWEFAYGAGVSRFAVERDGDHYRFVPVEDTAMRRWFAWETADLRVVPTEAGSRLELTLRYDPALGPDWYFGAVERLFLRAAGEHLLDALPVVAP